VSRSSDVGTLLRNPSPVTNTDLGLEYIYANRKSEDGLKGHLNRLQASAKYTF